MDTESAFGTYEAVNLQRRYRALLDKRVPGSIRKLVKRYIRKIYGDTVIDHTDHGIRLRCYPFQNVHDMSFATGQLFRKEEAKFEHINKNINKIDYFIDVGANTGTICIPLAVMYPDKKIFALEPNPEAFARLRFNYSLNNAPNLTLVNAGLGDAPGRKKLFVAGNIGGSSMHEKANTRAVDVDMMTIDQFCEEKSIENGLALKIDVEGYEDRVIMPFFDKRSRDQWPGLVILEHIHKHLWERDCIEFMLQHDYELVHSDGSDSILRRKMSAGL
jgi:FkbM family methyltransferase